MDGEKRSLAAKEYDALFGELEYLRGRNVLEPETVAAARELYDRVESKNVFHKTAVLVSVLLGVAALGFGIWVLVDEYWRDLSDFLQLYSVLVPFGASCVGYLAARIMKKELAAQIALFSVCGFFFLSCLVLRTFDQRLWPDVTVVWLAGALAAALAAFFSDGIALHLFAAILCAVRIITGCVEDCYPLWAGGPYALDALLIVAMGFYWSYRRVNMRVGGFYFLLLVAWAVATAFDARPYTALSNLIVVAAGSALALISAWGRKLRILDKTSFWPPYFLAAGALLFASFRSSQRYYDSFAPKVCPNSYLLYLLWIAAAAGLAFWYWRRSRVSDGAPQSAGLSVLSFLFSPEGVALLTVPMAIVSAASGEFKSDDPAAYFLSFYGTALVFGVASRLVVVGSNGRSSILTAGVAYFIIWFISRLTGAGRGLLGVWIFLAIAVGCFALAYFTGRMKKLAAVREPDPEPVLTREPPPVVPKIVGDVAAWLTVVAMIAAVIAVLCSLWPNLGR